MNSEPILVSANSKAFQVYYTNSTYSELSKIIPVITFTVDNKTKKGIGLMIIFRSLDG